jgi:hypothetical protein
VDRRAKAFAEFCQGGVRLFGDQRHEAFASFWVHFGRGSAGVGQGGKGAGFASALQQASNPGGADAKEFSKFGA